MRHVVERKAVRLGERDDDVVLGGGRLDLEVELATEALAQRQAPGAVEPAAIGRMQHELHATRLVEEAFEDEGGLRWQAAQSGVPGAEIIDELPGGPRLDGQFVDQPTQRRLARGLAAKVFG